MGSLKTKISILELVDLKSLRTKDWTFSNCFCCNSIHILEEYGNPRTDCCSICWALEHGWGIPELQGAFAASKLSIVSLS